VIGAFGIDKSQHRVWHGYNRSTAMLCVGRREGGREGGGEARPAAWQSVSLTVGPCGINTYYLTEGEEVTVRSTECGRRHGT